MTEADVRWFPLNIFAKFLLAVDMNIKTLILKSSISVSIKVGPKLETGQMTTF